MSSSFKKGKPLNSQAREIVHNVTAFFAKEAAAKCLSLPIAQACKRTAAATRVSVTTVKKIKLESKILNATGEKKFSSPGKHRKKPSHLKCEVEEFEKCTIRQVIRDFYIDKKKVPSLSDLLGVLKEKIHFPWKRETLRRVLHSIHFHWKRCGIKRKFLIEKPDIVAWRNKYLRSMQKHRLDNRTIVYVIEGWMDSEMKFGKFRQGEPRSSGFQVDSGNSPKDQRLVIIHAGFSEGFIPGAELIYNASSTNCEGYHGQMNTENFEKWVQERLIPNLPPNSVICVDNAPHNTRELHPVPTKYALRDEMVKWLKDKNIPYDPNMRKVELFDIVLDNMPKSTTYKIDSMLKDKGHDIARLPPTHCDLNAMEYVWNSIMQLVKEKNVTGDTNLKILESLLKESFSEIDKNDCEKHCNLVANLENVYWEKDGLVEELLDNFVIQIESSDSESYSEDDADESESDFDTEEDNND